MRYFIADLHNGDETILKCECRPFRDILHMRDALVENWNNTVNPEDEVFLLGDIGDPKILEKLQGNILIVIGNHDNYKMLEGTCRGLHNVTISRYPVMADGLICSHEPVTSMPEDFPYLNIHGHTHSLSYGKYMEPWSGGRRHFCVSVEQVEYKPISEHEISKIINYCQWRAVEETAAGMDGVGKKQAIPGTGPSVIEIRHGENHKELAREAAEEIAMGKRAYAKAASDAASALPCC